MEEKKGKHSKGEFDLAERTAVFGESAIQFARRLKRDEISGPLIRQFIRASTSIGANYVEADESGSKKEFAYRISLCCRESRETQHWLRMLAAALPESKSEARNLWREAKELTLIFASILRSMDSEEE